MALFEAFEKALDLYSHKNYVVFVKRDCRTVERANTNLKSSSRLGLYEGKFKYSFIEFTCKHYGETIITGKGLRPKQR